MKRTVSQLLSMPLRVLSLKQNTQEWLEVRKRYRTASETPIIMGISPWSSPSELAMEKFSRNPPKELNNPATAHGHKFEDTARRLYEEQYDRAMNPAVVVRGDYMASLDGWSRDRKLILEIKCPFNQVQGDTWEHAIDGKLPDYYAAQVQHQLMVSGAPLCHFWVYASRRGKAIMVEVKRDPKMFPIILSAWESFMNKYA